RQTGGLLRRSFRASDVVARYGGEEFLIVFPEIEPTAALHRIRSFHATFTDSPALPATAQEAGLTFSAGLATYPGDGEPAADLLHRADERLYAAKEAGRNRVERGSPKV